MNNIQENIDNWIKHYNDQLFMLNNNNNHNYELIKELRNDVNNIIIEIKTLKLLILLMIKETR